MQAYTKEKQIGKGAFGCAWLVKSKNGGTLVAKEVNLAGMSKEDRAVAQQEASVLRKLNHPNIIGMYEDFIEGDHLVIIMEYAGGGDLDKMLRAAKGNPLSEPLVLDLFFQILQGMEHVHSARLLHRDIKPANILLTSSSPPRAKLADFGVARVLSANTTQAQTVIGTPYYLSPEMVESKGYNQKSDVWALGCVLYELLALKHAFGGDNIAQVVLKIMKGSPAPLPSSYGSNVRELCMSMFAVEPSLRPSVSEALAHAAFHAAAPPQPPGTSAARGSSVEPARRGGSDKDVRKPQTAQPRRYSTEGGYAGGPGAGGDMGMSPKGAVAGAGGGVRRHMPLPAPPVIPSSSPKGGGAADRRGPGRVAEVGHMDGGERPGRPGSRERVAERAGPRPGSRETRGQRATRGGSRERGASQERAEKDCMGLPAVRAGGAQGGSERKLVSEESVKQANAARVRRKSTEEKKEVEALPSHVQSALSAEENMQRQLARLLG